MKSRNRITALIICILLFFSLRAATYAHDVPNGEIKGSITVEMKYGEKEVVGGSLTAYRIGQVKNSDGNYCFEKTNEMKAFDGSYEDIASPELAENAAAFVKSNKISEYAVAKNQDGKAVFSSLDSGLYLIVQTEASDGYEPLKPFLVSVPMNENGQYIYDVNAKGKFQLQQAQTTVETSDSNTLPDPNNHGNSDKPSTPNIQVNQNTQTSNSGTAGSSAEKLPQTGQLNWPIPLLAALGLLLFAFGWFLSFGRKSDTDEE